jgi:RNA-binding protein YhbY
MKLIEIQLGKNGVSDNFIGTLKNHFTKANQVRIAVLKNAGHDKESVEKYSEEILTYFDKKYTAKRIGFKIIIKKWRKDKR